MRDIEGPAKHLRAVGIEVTADLPGVGANLHDHPLAGVSTPPRSRFRPPGANTHATVLAIAERAASLISITSDTPA